MATHFHQLEVAAVQQETPSCISVLFHVPPQLKSAFSFIHGQNITLKAVVNGEELRRSYSICSSPAENELRIAIKNAGAGGFSHWAHSNIKKGALIDVLPPSGRFYTELNPLHTKTYVAFAAGSGITPLLSIIKSVLLTEKDSRFVLVYGNRDKTSIIFFEELENLKNTYMQRFSVHYILSAEKTDLDIYNGRINEDKCDQLFAHFIDIRTCNEFFICGPEQMIFTVKEYLEKRSVPKNKIHYELFTVPGQSKSVENTSVTGTSSVNETQLSQVTVKVDGIAFDFELAYEGAVVLNAALARGANVPFACKGGVCATCRAKLVTGTVHMDHNYALEPDEVQQGYILTCQSHPRSTEVFIDFDI